MRGVLIWFVFQLVSLAAILEERERKGRREGREGGREGREGEGEREGGRELILCNEKMRR